MFNINLRWIVICCRLQNKLTNKILLSKKRFIVAEQFEISLLVVVDGDEDNTSVAEEFLGYAQAFCHKREPFAVAVGVLTVHIAVVIDEVFVAGVVGWVDVDDVDFTSVGVGKSGEGFEVVALDDDVVWIVNSLIISA